MKVSPITLQSAQHNGSEVSFLAPVEAMLAGLAASFSASVHASPSDDRESSNEGLGSAAPELSLRYRTLLEQIPAVVFMARLEDSESEAYVSPHIEAILGFTREEWLDDPIRWYYQIHPDDRDRWSIEASSFVLSGEPLRSVYRVLARDGHIVWFQCEVKMVRRPDGQPWFFHGVGIDVTDLKKAEQELKRARDSLEIQVEERTGELLRANGELKSEIAERKRAEEKLKQRAEELARSNADLEQFAYSASHDLQEPIRNVAISAQLLSREYAGGLDPGAQELLKTVLNSAYHMESLIRGLLEYTHLVRADEDGGSETDANQVMATVLQTLQMTIRDSGTQITWDSLPSVRLPRVRLQQLFQNLISNAIKYRSDKSPRIHVSVCLCDGSWLFSVQDNGIGIDPRHHGRIFGIFKRLHNKETYPGTGIGLALCKRIVENVGGRIWVESESGRGARFLFTIPGQ
jgi:PAS domain S-box-containing protein